MALLRGFLGREVFRPWLFWSFLGGWEVSAMPQLLSQAGCPLALVMYSLPRNSLKSFKKQARKEQILLGLRGEALSLPPV